MRKTVRVTINFVSLKFTVRVGREQVGGKISLLRVSKASDGIAFQVSNAISKAKALAKYFFPEDSFRVRLVIQGWMHEADFKGEKVSFQKFLKLSRRKDVVKFHNPEKDWWLPIEADFSNTLKVWLEEGPVHITDRIRLIQKEEIL